MPPSSSFLFVSSNFPFWMMLFLVTVLVFFGLSSVLAESSASASSSWDSKNKNIERVVVVGGTHGNEYTGVWCIKSIDRIGPPGGPYPSLQISTLLGNPQAYYENKRFIHSDLNREFTHDKLHAKEEEPLDLDDADFVGSEGMPLTVESLRAKELNLLLGPKFGDNPTDLIVDLHSTTSNMGTTIIIPEGDAYMAKAAAYVLKKAYNDNDKNQNQDENEVRILMHPIPDRKHRPNLCSTGRHGFTIEVGPVPQGVLRHDAVEKTQRAMAYLFEFLHRCNLNQNEQDAVLQELKEYFPHGRVPCFLSAAASINNSQQQQSMSGKIVWPSDPDNPNFPAVLVHKNLQDKDFHKIRIGDVLFVDLNGNEITYDGSHGDEVYLIFVNEGGYYYQSSGTGIGVAVDAEFDLEEGMLRSINKEEKETTDSSSSSSSDKEL